MKKGARKRFFSIIFVPDQERDPQSISMSYTKGLIILGLLILLLIHVITGGINYIRIIHLDKKFSVLKNENTELKAQNKKIEQIAKEFHEIRLTDEKIRKAFGGSLGLDRRGANALDNIPMQTSHDVSDADLSGFELSPEMSQAGRIQHGLYELKEDDGSYFNPENLPTLLPVEGYLTTHFQKGGWFVGRSHYGIDIATSRGSRIRSAGSGVVILSGWTQGFGNIVIISHGNGLTSYYAHAMRLLVEQGDHVRKGQSIALLGSTGISSAPHLHFEIWKNGEPLDPEQFLYTLQKKN